MVKRVPVVAIEFLTQLVAGVPDGECATITPHGSVPTHAPVRALAARMAHYDGLDSTSHWHYRVIAETSRILAYVGDEYYLLALMKYAPFDSGQSWWRTYPGSLRYINLSLRDFVPSVVDEYRQAELLMHAAYVGWWHTHSRLALAFMESEDARHTHPDSA